MATCIGIELFEGTFAFNSMYYDGYTAVNSIPMLTCFPGLSVDHILFLFPVIDDGRMHTCSTVLLAWPR